ncbi:MAG: Mur ligase domain-containing protein [Prevotellaceae bacterium]|jgi:UDP-N-acetylmuramate: L-alanyl-gamma-D-glutamyl-meso-diaminopimelate ligase|nr:Mur ligase domain-containing protein [Prevotellaceae bacterium]
MNRIHFIAIGGAAMHNLALALHHKGYVVTGSDDEIFEPAKSRLQTAGLLPEWAGWFPEKLDKGVEAVILGMHAREDNPELIRARELGLRIYSFPEYLYLQTQDKIRVVIGGSHGKTTITSMILFVLKRQRMQFDYMVGAQIEGFDTMVGLSDEARIAVFEGDEYLTSPIDLRPKFHVYQPHIALVSGIAWDHINVFPTFVNYVEQFRIFSEKIMREGKFIYFEGDKNLRDIAETVREDVTAIPYGTHKYRIDGGKTFLVTKNGDIPLNVFGEHNLQNINGARLVCNQLGISDKDFYRAISEFGGAANRLQKVAETDNSIAFKDFAHSPSKLRATVKAVKQQYPDRRLVACMELHTFSSLTEAFLPEYKDCMKEADIAFVYFNPEVIEHKKLKEITPEKVKEAFGSKVEVFTNAEKLQEELKKIDFQNKTLLMMSSGNFDGINVAEFAKELLQ